MASLTRRSVVVAAALAIAAPLAAAAPAAAETKLKMVLNWKYQGPQGFLFLADDRGYFKAAVSTSRWTRATARVLRSLS